MASPSSRTSPQSWAAPARRSPSSNATGRTQPADDRRSRAQQFRPIVGRFALSPPAAVASAGTALLDEQDLRVLWQRPEVVGHHLLELVAQLADAVERRELVVAGVHRQLQALDAVGVLVR